jgi:hypothetical protein
MWDCADSSEKVTYPNNVTLKGMHTHTSPSSTCFYVDSDLRRSPDLAYFVVVPTLRYDLNFPRTPSIRWRRVLRHVIEFVRALRLFVVVLWFLFVSWRMMSNNFSLSAFTLKTHFVSTTDH